MEKITTYKIKTKAVGRISQIPDSQKIFGALIHLYKDYISEKETTDFVLKIKEKKIYLSLSNMLPLNYLPMPQTYLLNELSKKEIENSKNIYKAIKKRKYIPKEKMKELLESPIGAKKIEIYPYISIESSQQTHCAIDSVRYDLLGLEPNIFSVPEITVMKVMEKEGEEKKDIVNTYYFYLSIQDSKEREKLLKGLEQIKGSRQPFFLGTHASQGMNIFSIEGIEIEQPFINRSSCFKGNKGYLNLGMLLPHEIDYEKSTLKLFTSERRPYDKLEGLNENYEKKFISFIEAGCMIYPVNGIKNVSHCITSPFDDKAILFGNAFLYPISELKK